MIIKNKKIVSNDVMDELDELSNNLDEELAKKAKNIYSGKNSKTVEIDTKFGKSNSDFLNKYNEENNASLPINYGNKWSDDDKTKLIDLLKKNKEKEIDYVEIANKLGRSEGGVKGEIKKIIITRYLNGEEAEKISIDMNLQYKFVKIIIYSYIDSEIDNDIKNLEKENKLLKLKMENIELRKTMFSLSKK
jgi:hypothetical protein